MADFHHERSDPQERYRALEAHVEHLEQKLAEQEAVVGNLLRLHLQLPAVLETVKEALLLVDPSADQVVEVNDAATRLLGRSEEELLALRPESLCPDDAPSMLSALESVVREGRAELRGVPCQRPDGETLVLDLSACRVDRNGRPMSLVAIRPQAPQGAASGVDERYRSLFIESRDAVYMTSRDGTILDTNPAFQALFGLSPEDAKTPTCQDLYADPADRARFRERVEAEEAVKDYPVQLRRPDGTTLDCLVSSTVHRDPDGRVLGYQGIVRDVSERVEGEARLRRSEHHYRSLIENTHDVITVIDREGRIRYQSPAARRVLGRDPAAQVGRGALEMLPEPDRTHALQAIAEGFQSGRIQRIEHRIRHSDGSLRYCQSLGRTYEDEDGALRAIISTRDFTAQHQAEQELRDSADRARRHERAIGQVATSEPFALGALPEACRLAAEVTAHALGVARTSIWLLDETGSHMVCHAAYDAAADRHSTLEPIPIADHPAYVSALDADRAVDACQLLDETFVRDHLTPFGITTTLDAAIRKSGRLVGLVSSDHIGPTRRWHADEVSFAAAIADQMAHALMQSERQEVDRGIRDREKFLTAIVENIPPLIFVKDAKELRYLRFNRAVEESLGYSRDELLGKTDHDIFPPAAADQFRCSDLHTLRNGVPLDLAEDCAVDMHGTTRMLHTKKIPILDKHGSPEYLLGIAEDVTERRGMEAQLRQTEKMSALGELIAGVAHELNNPMTGVLGFAQLLGRMPGLPDKALRYLERIGQEAERATKIVRNLLAFARKREPARRPIALEDLVNRVLDLRAYEMQVSNVTVERRLRGDLPLIWIDDDQMQQVFMNIVINAEQAMIESHGRGRLEVETDRDLDRDSLVVRFTNDGPAIPAEVRERIFDPFYTTKPEEQGTGLGLSISYGIVQQHGGTIHVDSDAERGTTFIVTLPVGAGEPPLVDADVSTRAADESSPSARVLVVDDEPPVRELVRDALITHGHRVESVEDGAAALRRIREQAFDAVVSDIKMPEMDGTELYRACADLDPAYAKRFLFLTGDVVARGSMDFLMESGCPHIQKPFPLKELGAAVERVLAAASPRNGKSPGS